MTYYLLLLFLHDQKEEEGGEGGGKGKLGEMTSANSRSALATAVVVGGGVVGVA